MDGLATLDTRAVHVGRQPIYDVHGTLVGYELLFRGDADAREATSRGAYATSQVLVTACTEFGLERLTGNRLAFVNLTREFLVGDLPLPFEPHQAVLEVLETVAVDDEVIRGVDRLAGQGYRFALDDFLPGTSAHRLIERADIVKVDTLGVSAGDLGALVRSLRVRPDQRLLAERVETPDNVAVARELGFSLFQGYALGRPEVVSARRLSASRLGALRLLGLLANPASSMSEVNALISADPALCYRLLTTANSAANVTSRRVTSVAQAAVLIGSDRLREWLTLIMLADLAGDEERAASVLIQARFCYEIAARSGLAPDSAFTVGLLDAMCDLTGESRAELTAHVPLTAELAGALADGYGPLGELLATARSYRDFVPVAAQPVPDLATAYLAAITWTNDLQVVLA